MVIIFLSFLCLLSYVIIKIFISSNLAKRMLDHPNARSSHTCAVPRGAGIVFALLWASFLIFLYFKGFMAISFLMIFLPPVILISTVGFVDDKYTLTAKPKFLAQLIAALYSSGLLVFYSSDFAFSPPIIYWHILSFISITFILVWSTNLYNFMDGIDGIAALEALFVFGFGGYFIWYAGGYELATIIWAMAAIVLGFLGQNKPPAKIFMGDSGSALLGFLVALFSIVGEFWYKVPWLVWVILYGVFLFDSTVTLLRRIIHGDVWYNAHRLHAYQRLQVKGWPHKKILFKVAALNMVLAIFAILAFYFPTYIPLFLCLTIILLFSAYLFVEKLQPMYFLKSR